MRVLLRTTTLGTGVITRGVLLVILAVSFNAIVRLHFARQERQQLAEHSARIEAALQAELTELDWFVYDWWRGMTRMHTLSSATRGTLERMWCPRRSRGCT